ncbi:MAG: modulator of FtsH protease HflC [Clostridiales bacterium]|jgi:membrane protease subunit HflC|nr:modulator of FtsH protease HflC [Clostridiales bacterium]MDN5281182.1 modulator of FtsH protease HflC [Candidatus Ozemobacter sp.]
MKKLIAAIVLAIILFVVFSSAFVVREGEQAIVTRFGKPVGETRHAGLNFKVPFIDEASFFEKKILKWDGDPNQITTKEKKFIWVDATARWRIKDPLLFMKTVATQQGAHSRLDDIVDSVVRDAVSGNYLVDLVRGASYEQVAEETETMIDDENRKNREEIIGDILARARESTPDYGIDLIDVQIKRLNYVEQVRERVYERMISERNKVAAEYRSEGEGTKAEILGQMGKELKKIRSEAYRTSVEIKGEADARAARIYADAFSRDPEFYSFYRSLESIEKAVGSNSKLVLSADSEIYGYLKDSRKRK